MKELGSYLKKEREARSITIGQLSEAILISPKIIYDIEEGNLSRYEGDEQYVKMYIKKYANYLGLDGDELGQRYLSLTRELSLKELEEARKKAEEKKTVVIPKKSYNYSKPPIKPTVYEDKRYLVYVKYLMALVLVGAIIFLVWYGFLRTNHHDEPFVPPTSPNISGDVEFHDPESQNPEPSKPEEVEPMVVFTKNQDLDYTFDIGEAETFTFKIEFYNRSWAQLLVNGQVYPEFKSGIYHNHNEEAPEVVELTFDSKTFQSLSLNNGYNRGTRYYINGEELVLSEQEQVPGSVKLNLTLKKEG